MDKRLCIIIPCYNEAAALGTVLAELAAAVPWAELVVVNDCSTDATAEIAAAAGCATVLSLPVNLGIGGAVQTGLKYAAEHGYELAVKFDGDGQHQAGEIAALLAPVIAGEADVTIGSRFMTDGGFRSTPWRRLGIQLFRWVNAAVTGVAIQDITSGFRAYNRSALEFLACHYPAFDYPEPEEVVLLLRNRFRLKEVATPMAARAGGVSSITPGRSVYYMIKVLMAIFMVAVRPRIAELDKK